MGGWEYGISIIDTEANSTEHGEEYCDFGEWLVAVLTLWDMSSNGNEEKDGWEKVEILLVNSDK